jgi:hypothetical protein
MSCVKRLAGKYINVTRPMTAGVPQACDIPMIRHWIDMASMGGRVSAYCKMYCSSLWPQILRSYMKNDLDSTQELIKEATAMEDSFIVLDVTSLYPGAMAFCPMPMGSLRYLNPEGCVESIWAIECESCESLMTICPAHRQTIRPFTVVLIRGGLKRNPHWGSNDAGNPLRSLVGRKLKGRKERGKVEELTGKDVSGLLYTQEEDKEVSMRFWGEYKNGGVFGDVQAMTNVDLYWAWKSGYEYDIIGGYEWQTTYELQPLILDLFDMRVTAKREGNTCLDQAVKLVLNSLFGIHSQRVIRSVDRVLTIPPNIREADVKEDEFGAYIRANHQKIFDPRMKLKENIPLANGQNMIRASIPLSLGEGVGGYSPNHIGAAVLSWARHIMWLAMYSIPPGHLSYTDTDSLAVSEWWYNKMKTASHACELQGIPPLICTKGNQLLTYKNDHSSIFPNARVLFSSLGAKKVKLHVIGCPDTGKIQLCNTFKGFLKQDVNDCGDKLHPDHHSHLMSKKLLDILYMGYPSEYKGTRWSRGLGCNAGITIETNVSVQADSYTYLGSHSAYIFGKLHGSSPLVGGSGIIMNVPFGCDRDDGVYGLTNCEDYVSDLWVISPEKKRKKEESFTPPDRYIYSLPAKEWKSVMEKYTFGLKEEEMHSFVDLIYSQKHELYKPANNEEEWNSTLHLLKEAEKRNEDIGSEVINSPSTTLLAAIDNSPDVYDSNSDILDDMFNVSDGDAPDDYWDCERLWNVFDGSNCGSDSFIRDIRDD